MTNKEARIVTDRIVVPIQTSFTMNRPISHQWGKPAYYSDLKNSAFYASHNVHLKSGIFDFTFYIKRAMDADNVGGMAKAIIDGFRASGAIKDDNRAVVSEVRYRVCSPHKIMSADINIL